MAMSCSLAALFINESPDLYRMYRGLVSRRAGNGTQIEVSCKYLLSCLSMCSHESLPWMTGREAPMKGSLWIRGPSPLAPLWWVLGADGQQRPGLPKEVSGWLCISRCFCGDEAWLSHKCSNLCNREGAAPGTGAGKRGQVAICHSLSPAVVPSGLHKGPLSLGSYGTCSHWARGTFRPPNREQPHLTFQNGAARSKQMERTPCSWVGGLYTKCCLCSSIQYLCKVLLR